MAQIIQESTLLSPKDCLNIVDRHKNEFTYPLHQHREFELNFIQNGAGAKRIVGDSIEEIGDLELVLIGRENMGHAWLQNKCRSKDIREITIQFDHDLFSGPFLEKKQFNSIRQMLKRASYGIAFPKEAIIKVYAYLDSLVGQQDHFMQILDFLRIMYELSKFEPRMLSSSSFAQTEESSESRRVTKIKTYINKHYKENITLEALSALTGMSPCALSHFFKQRTGTTISEVIAEIRLGYAARDLVNTTKNISEICFSCGFNNLSNFNKSFKARKGVTPKEFRQVYKKKRVII